MNDLQHAWLSQHCAARPTAPQASRRGARRSAGSVCSSTHIHSEGATLAPNAFCCSGAARTMHADLLSACMHILPSNFTRVGRQTTSSPGSPSIQQYTVQRAGAHGAPRNSTLAIARGPPHPSTWTIYKSAHTLSRTPLRGRPSCHFSRLQVPGRGAVAPRPRRPPLQPRPRCLASKILR